MLVIEEQPIDVSDTSIPAAIKNYLISHNVTQKELCIEMNWPGRKLCHILTEKQRLLLEDYLLICVYLKVPANYFFDSYVRKELKSHADYIKNGGRRR